MMIVINTVPRATIAFHGGRSRLIIRLKLEDLYVEVNTIKTTLRE